MAAPPSDEHRIKQGLKFLAKADKDLSKAAVVLEKLVSGSVSVPSNMLKKFTYIIQQKTFSGTMTDEQNQYLLKYVKDFKTFADAIARILINVNNQVLKALIDLAVGLGPTAKKQAPHAITPPPTGCCYYDTNLESPGITQTFCLVGLAGTDWKQGSNCSDRIQL